MTRNSLKREFLLLAGFILLAVIALSAWFTWRMYNVHAQTIIQGLETQASRIERTFTDNMDYTSYLMNYLSMQIRDNNAANNRAFIQQLLASYRLDPEINSRLPWTMYSWANAEDQLIINSDRRVQSAIPIMHREYVASLHNEPWKMHLSKSTYGLVSGKWILPAGMGVTNHEGEYTGATLFGINLQSLSRILENAINAEGYYFAIVDTESQIIADSKEHFISEESGILEKLPHLDESKAWTGILSKLSLFGESDGYSIYQKFPKYPYTLVVSYDKELSRAEIWKQLFSRIIEFVVIGVVALLVLIALHHRIVAPIVRLSKAADQISQGKRHVSIPASNHYEIKNLAQNLGNIAQYLNEIQQVKDNLEEKSVLLKRAKEEAEAAKEIAERANAAKSDFLANMSHELRTPLNAVINLAAVLLMQYYGKLSDKQEEYLGDIKRAGEDLLTLINDVLDLSKAESGKLELDTSVADLYTIISRCETLVAESALNRHVQVVNRVEAGVLPKVMVDELKIKQVLLNLLSNAVKFSDKEKSVVISAGMLGEELYISITDQGTGIAEEDIPVVLEKYGQARNPYKRLGHQGTGLGLPLVQSLIEAHQGRFELHSEINQGTIATIYLPSHRVVHDNSDATVWEREDEYRQEHTVSEQSA